MWRTQADLAGNCSKKNFLCRILCVSRQKCLLESNSTPWDVCCSWFNTGHNVHVDPGTQSKYSPIKWRSKIHLSQNKKINKSAGERRGESKLAAFKARLPLLWDEALNSASEITSWSFQFFSWPFQHGVQTRWKLLLAIGGRKLKEFYLVAFSTVHISILCFHVGGDKVEAQIAAPFQVSLLKAQFSLSPFVCRC